MWAIINIASPRWDTPSRIDMCETEEEAEAFVKWLNDNGYGGCSDWSFVKVEGRIWKDTPQPLYWNAKHIKLTLLPDGSFEEEVSERTMTGDRWEQENEWNYSPETVEGVKNDGFHISTNEPRLDRWNTKGPYINMWVYSSDSAHQNTLASAVAAKVEEAKELLTSTYTATVKPAEPVEEEVVWTEKPQADADTVTQSV